MFKGSHQMPRASTLSEDENPNFSRPAMLAAACHMIRLFCTSPLKINQVTKTSTELFPAIYMTVAHNFSMLDSL